MANLGNTTRPAYVYDAETDTWCPIGVGAHTHDQIPASIVDAKGDLIVGTAADTVQRRAVGADGSYLIADSTQTTGLNWAGPSNIAGKNAVINGGFDIWQRGTSIAGNNVGGASYWADRWNMYRASSPTAYTLSQQTTGGTAGITNYARVQRTAGNTTTATITMGQTPEILNIIGLAGQAITVSFYARAGANYSPTSGALAYALNTGTGTTSVDGIYNLLTSQATAINTTATLTTSWQRFTSTATLGSTITQLSLQFNCTPTGTAGSADYYDITGVQLELGSTATPFNRAGATIQQELSLCQRYYEPIFGGGSGGAYTSTAAFINCPFKVEKRTAPILVTLSASCNLVQSNAAYIVSTGASYSIYAANGGQAFAVYIQGLSGMTANYPLLMTNMSVAPFAASAEI